MGDNIRLRSSCDRCHAHKLRCPKRPSADICERCLKAKATCSYSPFRQKKVDVHRNRDREQGRSNTKEAIREVPSNGDEQEVFSQRDHVVECAKEDDLISSFTLQKGYQTSEVCVESRFSPYTTLPPDISTGIDFTDFGLDMMSSRQQFGSDLSFLNRSPNINNQLLPPVAIASSDMSSPPKTLDSLFDGNIPLAINWRFEEELLSMDTIGNIIKRMSKLNEDLFTHRKTLPCLEFIKDPPTKDDLHKLEQEIYAYRLEETFRLTQEMIDCYPTILSSCFPHDVGGELYQHSDDGPARSIQHDKVDHPTVLQALSCHLRAIEIYEHLFKHMGICVSMHRVGCSVPAPTLKIGNFTPPQSSAIPMQMLLLVQMSDQLSTYATELVSRLKNFQAMAQGLGTSLGRAAEPCISQITLGTAEGVSRRAFDITVTLSLLRGQLLSQGLLA